MKPLEDRKGFFFLVFFPVFFLKQEKKAALETLQAEQCLSIVGRCQLVVVAEEVLIGCFLF